MLTWAPGSETDPTMPSPTPASPLMAQGATQQEPKSMLENPTGH